MSQCFSCADALDIVFILDFSIDLLALNSDGVNAVKVFAVALLRALNVGGVDTRVCLVKYGRSSTTVLPFTDVTNVREIQSKINGIPVDRNIRNFGANVGHAIERAVAELSTSARPNAQHKAVLIAVNWATDTQQHHMEAAELASTHQISLYAVGLRSTVDAGTLRRIAQNDSSKVYLSASVNSSLDLIGDLAAALLTDATCTCRGVPGPAGAKGERGVAGPQGAIGPGGPAGQKGDRGDNGMRGEKGEDGLDGEKGDQGDAGPRGTSGQKGDRGAIGGFGPKGQKGQNGNRGPKGDRGPTGQKGEQGISGATGYGQKGQKGQSGIRGLKGDRGPTGYRGPPGPQEGGSVYTRWGRTSCPYGNGATSKVYDGYAAGTRHNTGGGGANMLCLPKNPIYSTTYGGHQGYNSLGAVEYEGSTKFRNVHNHNAPCAVCTTTRIRQLMIPGTTQCPSGWTREYWGYLTSEHHRHGRSEYLCFDNYQESIPGSAGNHASSAEIFTVEVNCEVLPCPPYSSTKELTCVVCTK